MKTKTKIVPFEVELAKKITAGEVAGKIRTRSGVGVKIINYKRALSGTPYPILYITETGRWEDVTINGKVHDYLDNEHEGDLVIELPVEDSDSSFKPFDKVLVRDDEGVSWLATLFSDYTDNIVFPYRAIDGCSYAQCIPFEGNQELVGTTKKPRED